MKDSLKLIIGLLILILFLLSVYEGIRYKKSDYKTDGNSQFQSQITQMQAEDLVRNLPEVKNKLDNSKSEWIINADDRKDNWYVQVAEVIEDTQAEDTERTGHTATFNWYKLDKNAGEIICSWFYYDKEGKRLEKKDDSGSC